MEILIALFVGYVLYRIFKRSSSYRKSEAAAIVQKLLEPVYKVEMFRGKPAKAARQYIQDVWDEQPNSVEDATGNRPDAVPVAAYALALAAKKLFERKDDDAFAVSIALGKALSGIQMYGARFREGRLNAHFINSAEQIYLTVVRPAIEEDAPAMRQLAEKVDSPLLMRRVEDNPAEGVFQMQEFPYATYEEWRNAYRKAASDANDGLKIQKADNGVEWSLIDLMDDAPLRSAFEHHLDPMPLGTYFGKIFTPEEMLPAANQ